jgi:hypothetical protein
MTSTGGDAAAGAFGLGARFEEGKAVDEGCGVVSVQRTDGGGAVGGEGAGDDGGGGRSMV